MASDAAAPRRGGEPLRQVLRPDRPAVAEDQGVLDHVGQLADVARPGVLLQHRQGLGREQVVVAAGRGAVAARPGAGPTRPMSPIRSRSGGKRNLERVDAEPEVLAELAGGHHRVQAAVGGADHAGRRR